MGNQLSSLFPERRLMSTATRNTLSSICHTPRVLGIFAHNESSRISRCIDSLIRSQLPEPMSCFVLVNGCTDDTVAVARHKARHLPWIKVEEIGRGGKSNAWNVYIHELAPAADTYFFLDGDCTVSPRALQGLEQTLQSNSGLNAVTALPKRLVSSAGVLRRAMLTSPGLAGNLYALPGHFVARIRSSNVRLPDGCIGDDSMVGALACWNLDPTSDWNTDRIGACREAEFAYDTILATSVHDPLFYYRRRIRYSIRHFQNRLLGEVLARDGLGAMPRAIQQLYTRAALDGLRPRSTPTDALFDRIALHRMRLEGVAT